MCEEKGLKKPRTVADCKAALVCKWLNSTSPAEVANVTILRPSAKEFTSRSTSSTVPASSTAVPANNAERASVLDQLVPFTEDFDDQTPFFSDIRQGPPLEDNLEPPMKDIIAQGEHGLIPVAALVKILQALSEMEPFVQVAVLFAQDTILTTAKLKRPLVRRVMMGTAQQCENHFEAELRSYPHLYVWGVIAEKNNHMFIQAEETPGFLDNLNDLSSGKPLHIGMLNSENMPSDLTKAKNWTLDSFLDFRGNVKVQLSFYDQGCFFL